MRFTVGSFIILACLVQIFAADIAAAIFAAIALKVAGLRYRIVVHHIYGVICAEPVFAWPTAANAILIRSADGHSIWTGADQTFLIFSRLSILKHWILLFILPFLAFDNFTFEVIWAFQDQRSEFIRLFARPLKRDS